MNEATTKINDLMQRILANMLCRISTEPEYQPFLRAELRGMITALRYQDAITTVQANTIYDLANEAYAGTRKFTNASEATNLVLSIFAD